MRAREADRRRGTEALARAAWETAAAADPAEARRWLERARRLVPGEQNIAFALATARLADGDPAGALALFEMLAATHDVGEVWTGIAAASLAAGDLPRAARAMRHRLAGFAPDAGADAVAARLSALGVSLPAGRALSGAWRLEGVVARQRDTLSGWAWHPGAPSRDPVLHVLSGGALFARITATDFSAPTDGSVPLGRPRRFRLAGLPPGVVRVIGEDGRDLLGSPLPAREPGPPPPGRPARRPRRPGPVSVIVPVYRGLATTRACLDSVRATLRPGDRLLVVDDASPEPALRRLLAARAAAGELALIPSCAADPGRNLGFPGAANAGLRAATGDVVLLNSDTLVFPGWLDGLQQAAHSAADIGTVTPVGNDASVFSIPDPAGNDMPTPVEAARLAQLAALANPGITVDVPTAHGFCMFIRADCLAATGLLREDVFAQGYGEENDFTERASAGGFRHVAAPGVYVAHVGGVSFGAARRALLARNLQLLARLHPGYHAKVAAFVSADPLRPSRARFDAARWRAGASARGAVLLVSHAVGGGTARVVAARAAAARAAGLRPILLSAESRTVGLADYRATYPNLRYRLPADATALAALLAPDRPVRAEIHHLLGHDHSIMALVSSFGIPYDFYIHDYAAICPRVVLTHGEGHYCGEPPAAICDGCVARWGRALEERISARRLRARSAADLAGARRVVAPSEDAAARIRRHFPGVPVRVVPWERAVPAAPSGTWSTPRRVVAIGAIGIDKGYDVLLACARDAAARSLPLHFVVAGYTTDDAALLDTGRAWITGPFEAGEADALIRSQHGAFAFIPSIWPETWCFALTDAWQAGLDAAVFDIGAPAARVRQSGRGWVLPLGLPPPRVNDALLNIQPAADTPVRVPARNAAGQGRERRATP